MEFHQLHHQSSPFILANVWNVRSAQIVENCGFKAMATSSGAIAESLGYKDGEQIPFAELCYIVERIKKSTSIPFSVDLERGYTNNMEVLLENIRQLIDAGVAGINLEDHEGEDIYLRKLSTIKNYLLKTHQQLFINARTDAFLQKLPAPLETTISRAQRYQDAGADGLFVTGLQDTATIKKIVTATTLPVNVVGLPQISSVEILAACGVKRISMAGFLYKATYRNLEKIGKEILLQQSLAPLY
ncbi:isocitrate lyase/phosphoenolpyruvate mutase family protein [Chitinophaga eiseniae]|uniref:Isocitrate lyase/phosphoenolpyruvate mutase family protein n=1 Tax=Chitinophaga eiseniae TaxID=634771 RepID=A0A847S861_9BACT|nr:isocitrate lyase/phosphoenolpyruvate mutase family protein [Chitinophaga eiseniae]NLR77981.1 isocitrate lyase/phosphoenolpyruvate mutase family protein [Chitinophaga eiseniae]